MALAVHLSPANWPPAEKARAESQEQTVFPAKVRLIESRAALVTATLAPIAIRAGIEALKQGETAADAASTVALTQVTTALGSYVSYAGILQLIYYDSHTRKIYSLDAGWNSYLAETDPKTIPATGAGAQGRTTLVPGFMAGIQAMHKRFGRLPFASLFQPAIWYAENGVTISPLLASYFASREKVLARTPDGLNFMHQAGEHVPKAGDRFIQTDLARTLRSVAREGAAYMYTGAWGRDFVDTVRREGGHASLEDMRRYRPVWDDPRNTTFVDGSVFAPPGSKILQALNLITEKKIDRAQPYFKDWTVFRDLSNLLQSVELEPDPPRHSAAIVVIDKWGNVAALVHSINAVTWGSTGIVVGGIPIPDPAGLQQWRLAAIQPGDRVPRDMAPVIVMRGAKPVMAVAAVGASLLAETARILLGALGNHLDLQTVMEAPPLLYNFQPPKAGETAARRTQFVPEAAYSPDFLSQLEAASVSIEKKSRLEVLTIKGTAVVGAFNPEAGVWRAIETPALFGFADAY
jgi:gamma-glutamyltranspeptidase/glutathione hydrolase